VEGEKHGREEMEVRDSAKRRKVSEFEEMGEAGNRVV
jgi:hypothetical protein